MKRAARAGSKVHPGALGLAGCAALLLTCDCIARAASGVAVTDHSHFADRSGQEVTLTQLADGTTPMRTTPVGAGPGTAGAPAAVPLRNTRWRIVEVDGKPVRADGGESRAPTIQFAASGDQVTGRAVCNALNGHFVDDVERLRFERLTLSRVTCPGPAARQERRLLAALQATAGWQITGGALQLRDARGHVRVRAEAPAPP